jgi:hypothetical protein
MPHYMRVAFFVGCLFVWGGAAAAPVTVSGDNPRDSITVVVENTALNDVLRDLSAKYGFAVNGIENALSQDPLTVTMSGSLQSILERLLRNWNHMIVRSASNDSGIEKVMILDPTYGSLPSKFARTKATQDVTDPTMQAQSGQN